MVGIGWRHSQPISIATSAWIPWHQYPLHHSRWWCMRQMLRRNIWRASKVLQTIRSTTITGDTTDVGAGGQWPKGHKIKFAREQALRSQRSLLFLVVKVWSITANMEWPITMTCWMQGPPEPIETWSEIFPSTPWWGSISRPYEMRSQTEWYLQMKTTLVKSCNYSQSASCICMRMVRSNYHLLDFLSLLMVKMTSLSWREYLPAGHSQCWTPSTDHQQSSRIPISTTIWAGLIPTKTSGQTRWKISPLIMMPMPKTCPPWVLLFHLEALAIRT